MVKKFKIDEIEDVEEPFCGCGHRNLVALQDKEPEIAAEWLYKKNVGWGPDDFSHGSSVRAWWRCPDCRREYKKQICVITSPKSRRGCPYCANRRVCSDNALSVLFPEIAREWHPILNRKLKATDVVAGTHKIVWWICRKRGHVWQQQVSVRTRFELKCPDCYRDDLQEAANYSERDEKGRIVLGKHSKKGNRIYYDVWKKSYTPLTRSHPKIAKQWHPTSATCKGG
jgi:hypothetical protein